MEVKNHHRDTELHCGVGVQSTDFSRAFSSSTKHPTKVGTLNAHLINVPFFAVAEVAQRLGQTRTLPASSSFLAVKDGFVGSTNFR